MKIFHRGSGELLVDTQDKDNATFTDMQLVLLALRQLIMF